MGSSLLGEQRTVRAKTERQNQHRVCLSTAGVPEAKIPREGEAGDKAERPAEVRHRGTVVPHWGACH